METSKSAKKNGQLTAEMRRDLNPHKAARFAMWKWGKRYVRSGLGSMGFWDSLSKTEQDFCRDAVRQICAARDESGGEAIYGK